VPVISLDVKELERLVGVDINSIIEKLPMIGCSIERITDETVDVEFFPNRPDLYSIEGVARALRGFLDIEKGYKDYNVVKGNWKIYVDPSVKDVRPRIAGCVVKNIKLTDEVIKSLIELQEDLHWTIGRNRRKMAIGLHDFDKFRFPLRYTAVDGSFSFVPLDFSKEMTVREILDSHPKGLEFGFILEGKTKYPMIIDSDGDAISFPPIINAEKTRITEDTRNIFIDVTGFDENVDRALNILATMLADRGGVIESVDIVYQDRKITTPDLSPKIMKIRKNEVFSLLGFEMDDKEIKTSLERMRFGVKIMNNEIEVKIPPYRADIMHEWDIIEDIAIGYGYDRIEPRYPRTNTIGESHIWNDLKDIVREIMIGLGFLEVITFTLTNEKIQYKFMNREGKPWDDYVPVMHPLTEEHTIIRTDLLPKLLELLSLNKHYPMPQRIFEIGDVVVGLKNELKLCACITHAKANFAEIRSVIQSLMKELNLEWDVSESADNAFIKGRRADIIVKGKNVGVFGEIHPEVLERFKLSNPVVAFEINLTKIFDLEKKII